MDLSDELHKLPHLMDIPEDCWDLGSNSSTTWFPLDSHELWVVPLLACSSVNVLVILSYEVYIVSCSRVSTSFGLHLFLGQMLLLGLLLGSCLGFVFIVESSPLSCIAIRIGTGLAYVIIYGALLVKLVFLVALNSGVFLPIWYQIVLFFFCILVQVVVDVQWVFTVPYCQFITQDHLYSLFYVIFLIFTVTGLAVKSRYIMDHYREANYICVVMFTTLGGWVSWITAAVLVEKRYEKPCFGFGLVLSCSITFVVMFLPKSRQQTAMGKEGVYLQEQNDTFSISSVTSHLCQAKNQYVTKDEESYNRFCSTEGSYLGFHRPSRVVPPKSSPDYTSSVPSFLLPPPVKPTLSQFHPQNLASFQSKSGAQGSPHRPQFGGQGSLHRPQFGGHMSHLHQQFHGQNYHLLPECSGQNSSIYHQFGRQHPSFHHQKLDSQKSNDHFLPSYFTPNNFYQYRHYYSPTKGMNEHHSSLFNRGRRKYDTPRIFFYKPSQQPIRY